MDTNHKPQAIKTSEDSLISEAYRVWVLIIFFKCLFEKTQNNCIILIIYVLLIGITLIWNTKQVLQSVFEAGESVKFSFAHLKQFYV